MDGLHLLWAGDGTRLRQGRRDREDERKETRARAGGGRELSRQPAETATSPPHLHAARGGDDPAEAQQKRPATGPWLHYLTARPLCAFLRAVLGTQPRRGFTPNGPARRVSDALDLGSRTNKKPEFDIWGWQAHDEDEPRLLPPAPSRSWSGASA